MSKRPQSSWTGGGLEGGVKGVSYSDSCYGKAGNRTETGLKVENKGRVWNLQDIRKRSRMLSVSFRTQPRNVRESALCKPSCKERDAPPGHVATGGDGVTIVAWVSRPYPNLNIPETTVVCAAFKRAIDINCEPNTSTCCNHH